MNVDLQEVKNEYARRSLLNFTKHTMDGFDAQPFHVVYYTVLDMFAKAKIKKLIVTMPPQHGKSEGSTRRLPSYMLGHDPDKRIAIASYNTPFARKFNRDIQRIIDDKTYHDLFPETYLNQSNVVTVSSNYLRNAEEIEMVDKKGSLKAVGKGGPLTGNPVDIMIMDDLYKDYSEGNSPIIRQSVWDWYLSTVKTRLHNDSQELIVFTRWNEDDLVGRLEHHEEVVTVTDMKQLKDIPRDAWVKINFEAIMESGATEIDPREDGASLWETKHSKHKLEKVRDLDIENFNCLYQGNPMSAEGMLYDEFQTYKAIPQTDETKNYTDTADTGEDFLCSICYKIPSNGDNTKLYVTDILYTDKPMEQTEGWTADMLNRNKVDLAEIESNNGGRGFARAVEKMVGPNVVIDWFSQNSNKESRIHTRKAAVMQRIIFPDGWEVRFPEFYRHIMTYKKLFKANKQDGGPDVLTGIIEKNDDPGFWVM